MLPLTIPEAFAAVAARRPDHPCLVWGDDAIPYAAAHERIGRVAAGFVRLGAGPGDRVACYLGNGPEFLWTWLGAHPAVLESAVVGVPSALAEDDVVAVVVPRPGAAATEAELQAWCAERLARFKVPGRVLFVDALPKTPTAKVQKDRLRAELRASPGARSESQR